MSSIGIFSCYQTNFFVVDIDNHDQKANVDAIYSHVFNTLGTPSLVCKSPHGLHVYYCLKDYYDANLLSKTIKSILKLDIEVKPTPNTSIRFLSKNNLLDPTTLNYVVDDLSFILKNCITYNVSEFLCLTKIENKKVKKDSIDIIFKGETNDALNTLIPQWKSQGFSNEECANKFISKLDSSYTGDCRNYNHVLKRVKCYKVLPQTNSYKLQIDSIKEKNSKFINSVINHYKSNSKTNFYNKDLRSKSIENMIVAILYAKNDSEAVIANKELLSIYNTQYPYYEYEVSKGAVPLPSAFFESVQSNYRPIFNYLYSIGFIKRRNGRSYDTNRHSCQYYSIDMNCMNKYSIYAYHTVSNTKDIKSNIRLLLTSVFNVKCYVLNLYNNFIDSFSCLFLSNICFNMLDNCFIKNEENKVCELVLSG